jgi:hypothetical protein
MLKSLLHSYAFDLSYLKMLVGDIPEEQMCRQPGGMVNHPAWTLPHLVAGSEFAALLLGLGPGMPSDWSAKYGRGSVPVDDASAYPSKAEAMAALEKQHARVSEALAGVDPALLEQAMPNEEFRQIMPTIGDGLMFLLGNHEAGHLGQIAAWRQALGMPRVLG